MTIFSIIVPMMTLPPNYYIFSLYDIKELGYRYELSGSSNVVDGTDTVPSGLCNPVSELLTETAHLGQAQ